MWTAKRFLILIGGLLLALSNYAVYALFLGGIDGLAPLPIEFLPDPNTMKPGIDRPIVGEQDIRLEQAFGAGREELRRPLKLWLPDKGIVFAAGEFKIDPKDGRVRLAPFSAAMYHKSTPPGAFPEISTIRCEVAYLTLDRPIKDLSQLNGRKVIGVEMRGNQPTGITLSNNRRTPEKKDDVDIYISNGNLYYDERLNKIWTDGNVHLNDGQTTPPTEIRGQGLDLLLAKESNPNRPRPAAKAQPVSPHADSNNIEKIILRSHVAMDFWVDSGSGFLGGVPNEKNPPADKAPPPKAHLRITTPGRFEYDLPKEYAWFESPPEVEGSVPIAPDQVNVTRSQKVNNTIIEDYLTCHRLDLKFRKKANIASESAPGQGGDKEIQTAKAISRGMTEVVLALNSEGSGAYGSEMLYQAGDASRGPLTILKGEANRPLRTFRDGHKMVSKELHLFAANRAGEGQHALAIGPGQVDLLDAKSPAKEASFPTHILFRDQLTVVKEKEGGQVFDLMTVLGEASFIDDKQKQELHGDKILVWILQTQESAKKTQASGGSRQELHRVLALGRVRAMTPEVVIPRANSLIMAFLPEVAQGGRLPELPPSGATNNVIVSRPAENPPLSSSVSAGGVEHKSPVEPKKASPPIELEGNEITMAIATVATKKQLQELIAKSNVIVYQPGDKPGTKRIDIRGQLLTLKQTGPDTHTMIVHGDKNALARLEMGDLILWGPLVTIDQLQNRTDVEGAGAMQVPSNKNLNGSESTKDEGKNKPRITIHWNKNMTFDGKDAYYFGGVQASQSDNKYSGLLCDKLIVTLDKTVSLRDGQKENQNAKIDRIVCDKKVYIDESKVDNNQQLVQRNILQGTGLYHREDGRTDLNGPGRVRTLALGGSNSAFAPQPGAKPNPSPQPSVWEQTRIDFTDTMRSNTKANTKNAKFYGANSGVEVFHFPTTKIEENMDPVHPPKDGFYLQCDYLEVTGQQTGNKTTQLMIADGPNVYFKTDQIVGTANTVTFNEATDIIIFEARGGNVVRLSKLDGATSQPIAVNATKVLYNRRTGQFSLDSVKSFSN